MARQEDLAAELRELCVTFAIQAGRKDVDAIVALAEQLKQYIQCGPMRLPGGIPPDQLTSENDC